MATAMKEQVEDAIKAVEVTGYSTEQTLFATRYKLGGRTVYSLTLSPLQVIDLIDEPDPKIKSPGNRQIKPKHAAEFAKYFRTQQDWTVPGMILRVPTAFKFESLRNEAGTDFGIITMSKRLLKDLHILDGQHRILGFHIAARQINEEMSKASDQKATARRQYGPSDGAVVAAEERMKELKEQAKRLETERVSVEILVEPDLKKARQLFFDIADNQIGITASVRSRFDTRRVVNRALEFVLEHPLLENRVDLESDRVGRGNPNLLGAKHVAELIRSVQVGLEGRVSRRQDVELSELEVASHAKTFLDVLVESFTPLQAVVNGQLLPERLRKTSLLGSVLMMRVLAGTYHELKNQHAWSDEMIAEYFSKLDKHMAGPVYPGSIWMTYLPESAFSDNTMAPSARRQDVKTVMDAMVSWALDHEKFIDEEPAPRPVVPVAEESAEPTAAEVEEILRPETAKARKERDKKTA